MAGVITYNNKQQIMEDLTSAKTKISYASQNIDIDYMGGGTMQQPNARVTYSIKDKQFSSSANCNGKRKEIRPAENDHSQTRKRSCYTYNILKILILLLFCLVCNVQGIYNMTKLEGNQAIYFDKISEMNLIQDEWKIVVYYDMQPYWNGSSIFNLYMVHLKNLCNQITKDRHCDVILLQLHHEFKELEHYNHMLLNQHFQRHPRKRRGLINGIGYVANSLFGVLDERFAEQYKKDIKTVRRDHNHLLSLLRNQTSIVEAENTMLKRVATTTTKQHELINKHVINLSKSIGTLKNEVTKQADKQDFILSTLILKNILSSLKNIQDSLLDTITNIQHLNVHLIGPTQLQSELNLISNELSKTDVLLPINNVETDLHKLYHIMKVKARMTHEFFIFELRIPLVNRKVYDIYHMIPIQHQLNDSMINVIPISEYIAVDIKEDKYLPISGQELQKCFQLNPDRSLCQLQKPIYERQSHQKFCVKNQEGNACITLTNTCKTTWTELNTINSFIITCCGTCTLRIICNNIVTIEHMTGVNIIALGNNCAVKGETFTITAHRLHSIGIEVKPEVIAINIAPVNNLFNLSLPTNISEIQEDNYAASFKNIFKQIEQMKVATEQVTSNDDISLHDVHHYMAIYCMGAAGLAFAVFVYMRSRSRQRTLQLELTSPQHNVQSLRASN